MGVKRHGCISNTAQLVEREKRSRSIVIPKVHSSNHILYVCMKIGNFKIRCNRT